MATALALPAQLPPASSTALERLAGKIRAHEAQAHGHATEALRHKVGIGHRLLEAKALLPHGASGAGRSSGGSSPTSGATWGWPETMPA